MPVIKKWGNSLALRIPMSLANQLNIGENSTVECTVLNGRLVVKPVEHRFKFSLCELLAGITEENIHEEIETGDAAGAEIW
jgi:antitoxin MazE